MAARVTPISTDLSTDNATPSFTFSVPASFWKTIGPEIGGGGSSIIFDCTKVDSTEPRGIFVLKKYRDPIDEKANRENLTKEIDMIRRINHMHVIRVRDVAFFVDDHKRTYLGIILEPRADMNLQQYLDNAKCESEDPQTNFLEQRRRILSWFICLTTALHQIHASDVVHRDLKPENILVKRTPLRNKDNELRHAEKMDYDQRIIITDFDISYIDDNKQGSTLTSTVGSVRWLAPECFSKPPYRNEKIPETMKSGPKSDVFSLGCIFWEMLCAIWLKTEENPPIPIKLPPPPCKAEIDDFYASFWTEADNKSLHAHFKDYELSPPGKRHLTRKYTLHLPPPLDDMYVSEFIDIHRDWESYMPKDILHLREIKDTSFLVQVVHAHLQNPPAMVLLDHMRIILKMVESNPGERFDAENILDLMIESRRALGDIAHSSFFKPDHQNCACTHIYLKEGFSIPQNETTLPIFGPKERPAESSHDYSQIADVDAEELARDIKALLRPEQSSTHDRMTLEGPTPAPFPLSNISKLSEGKSCSFCPEEQRETKWVYPSAWRAHFISEHMRGSTLINCLKCARPFIDINDLSMHAFKSHIMTQTDE